jgi:hypothetical protein
MGVFGQLVKLRDGNPMPGRASRPVPTGIRAETSRASASETTLQRVQTISLRASSRRTNFWILPVDVLGIVVNTKRPGTL